MGKLLLIFLSVISMMFSIVCIEKPQTITEDEVVQSTGYPSGEIQKQYIFWNEELYTADNYNMKDLPEDAYLAGEITKIDNLNFPDEDMEASRFEEGTKVYADGSGYLYVRKADYYTRFAVCNDAELNEE